MRVGGESKRDHAQRRAMQGQAEWDAMGQKMEMACRMFHVASQAGTRETNLQPLSLDSGRIFLPLSHR